MGLFSWWPFGRKHSEPKEDWEGEQLPDGKTVAQLEKPEDLPQVSEAEAEAQDRDADKESALPGSPLARGAPSLAEPPEWPGIYRIRYRGPSRRIMYIGVTSNLKKRKDQHACIGYYYSKLHYFYWQRAKLDTTARALIDVEARQIDKHKPPHNKYRGRNGRMEAAIELRLQLLREQHKAGQVPLDHS